MSAASTFKVVCTFQRILRLNRLIWNSSYHPSFHFSYLCFNITNTRWWPKNKLCNTHADTICWAWWQYAMLFNTIVVARVNRPSHVDRLRDCVFRCNSRYGRQQCVGIPRLSVKDAISITFFVSIWPKILCRRCNLVVKILSKSLTDARTDSPINLLRGSTLPWMSKMSGVRQSKITK